MKSTSTLPEMQVLALTKVPSCCNYKPRYLITGTSKLAQLTPTLCPVCVRNNPGMYSHLSVLRKAGVDVLRPSDIDNAGPGDMGGGYAYVCVPRKPS